MKRRDKAVKRINDWIVRNSCYREDVAGLIKEDKKCAKHANSDKCFMVNISNIKYGQESLFGFLPCIFDESMKKYL